MSADEPPKFVPPERPRRPRHHCMRRPFDFLYALLNVWDRTQLGHVMRVMGWALELTPHALCDSKFWAAEQQGVMPVLAPTVEFLAPPEAFARLAAAAHATTTALSETEEAGLVASMRLTLLIAFIVDYRVRLVVMANHAGFHGPLQTRPPDPYRIWHFLLRNAKGVATAYFRDMTAYAQRQRKAREALAAPPVLGLASVRGSPPPSDAEPVYLTQQRLAELRHNLFVPLT